MISTKTLKTIEFDKITEDVGKFAVLERTKSYFADFIPETDIKVARAMLDRTAEAYKLLYDYDVGGIVFFTETQDEIKRVESGGTLTIPEILRVVANLKSARILKESVLKVKDETIKYIPEIASRLFINKEFEKEISEKIASEDDLTDNASPKLYSIRKSIRNINAQIRDELNGFMRGNSAKYLQDGVITVRGDRYVVPVKSEYRSFIKGFIHDQSSSGATVFIEPEIVIELNNKLKSAMLDEEREKERILYELSSKISFIAEGLKQNEENISEADGFFARAIYSFVNKYNKPVLNDKGIIKVFGAKHPLIDKNKVVPIDFEIGDTFSFMLITGPNTGGKTVTLKLCGLITLMAMSGLFVPANSGAEV